MELKHYAYMMVILACILVSGVWLHEHRPAIKRIDRTNKVKVIIKWDQYTLDHDVEYVDVYKARLIRRVAYPETTYALLIPINEDGRIFCTSIDQDGNESRTASYADYNASKVEQ